MLLLNKHNKVISYKLQHNEVKSKFCFNKNYKPVLSCSFLKKSVFLTNVWWPNVANFNLNYQRNFKLHLNFIFGMKIEPKFTFEIGIRTQIDYCFCLHFVFYLLSSLINISLIRFDLIKVLLNAFSNGNWKSKGSEGPSWPITAIAFCGTNINRSLS